MAHGGDSGAGMVVTMNMAGPVCYTAFPAWWQGAGMPVSGTIHTRPGTRSLLLYAAIKYPKIVLLRSTLVASISKQPRSRLAVWFWSPSTFARMRVGWRLSKITLFYKIKEGARSSRIMTGQLERYCILDLCCKASVCSHHPINPIKRC